MSEQNQTPLEKLNNELEKKKITQANAYKDLSKAKTSLQTELSKLGSLGRVAFKAGSTSAEQAAYKEQDEKVEQAQATVAAREENVKVIASALSKIEKKILDLKESVSVENLKAESKASIDEAAQFFNLVYSITGANSIDELIADIKSKFTSY
ncbi:hypothetical protein ABNM11_24990 [Pseudomonas syringae]